MKTVTEILGGAQILLPLSFEIQCCFEEVLTEDHRCFISMLRVIEEGLPSRIAYNQKSTGRPPCPNEPIMRALLAMGFFRVPTITDLRLRLLNDPNLRIICGFTRVPSLATISRRLKAFSKGSLMVETLNEMVRRYHKGRIVDHICRDSTAIESRERPVNTKQEAVPNRPKPKRGRPKKGEVRPKPEPTTIEKQLDRSAYKSLSQLSKSCAWGCKRNSQGNLSSWKGYKLHLDISDTGFPITALVTGANVHDSQAAIPMEKLTGSKIQHLYSLMDVKRHCSGVKFYIRYASL